MPPALAMPPSPAAQHVLDEARRVGLARFTAPDFKPGLIRHVVMFRFNPRATQAERHEVTKRFVALASLSRRPNGAAVVVSIETGPQMSGENADIGLEQAYLVTFRSEGDRNFYVGSPIVSNPQYFDPAHNAFKSFAGSYLEKVVVFDFPVMLTTQN
ncbi:Dabb family protein [Acetobacter lambici]